jgi:dipeptidyl aminopeptidase/acylaminoacyl peptidase
VKRHHLRSWAPLAVTALLLTILSASAQVTPADYDRAARLRTRFQDLTVNVPEPANAVPNTPRFWYRKSVKGGNEFVLVDAAKLTKGPAFDHEKLATALNAVVAGGKYTSTTLPFSSFQFVENEGSIEFNANGGSWQCDVRAYTCKAITPRQGGPGLRNARPPEDVAYENPSEYGNDVYDGMVDLTPQAQAPPQGLQVPGQEPQRGNQNPKASPDGESEALVLNYNVFIRPRGAAGNNASPIPLSFDGSEGNYYTLASIAWSPDSKRLVAYRVRPGYRRQVHYVESSPSDQVQPKHWVRDYAKPGDALDIAQPVLIDVGTKQQIVVDNALFPNPYSLSNPVWRRDGRAFTFEYNQRGHQVYRVIEVDGVSGKPRAVINEESPTFIAYRPLTEDPRDTGRKYRYDMEDGQEVLWMSERDGWAHLYLYDGVTGKVKNQVTKGNWLVRAVDRVDEEKRQIWFQASGMYPGKDPYYVHWFRINFDGTGLVALTEADGDHLVTFSADRQYYVDTWSRVDLAPVSQLRRTGDSKPVMELERGDISALLAAGWRAPESFTTLGRDGKTDIWGNIYRPVNFDPSKKYPVVESIYAGPQGSFVPKRFSIATQALTELGFIVVQIDGMGTNNRSKAFHDVSFKDLGDAGFTDRILWHKAVAAKYPYYDITRVGVFGTSAGGQSALGALLFHPEFYKVAVSNSGCHDNRMDKIWWNEQWMSWPIGPEYAASSNVDNASKLQGRLLLVYGELDTNVDPSSTLQVANALIKANKRFDLLAVPGGGHGAGGAYYQRMMQDFFVHHLLGVEPPDWNKIDANATAGAVANRN